MLRADTPARSHAEIVSAIRLKIVELQGLGILSEDGAQLYQTQMLQLLGVIEQYREKCEVQADQWLQKYHYQLGRRESFTALRSILEGLINASINRARTAIEIDQELADVESTRIVIPDPQEPAVMEPSTDARPADPAIGLPEGALPEHRCICGRSFGSKRSLAGHRGRCAVFKAAVKAANGEDKK